MILHRIKQLYSAMTAEIRTEENDFINRYLNTGEQALFFQMSVVDQRHALDVSYHVQKALQEREDHGFDHSLIKAALLHDIGKLDGELTIFDRTLIVIMERLWPERLVKWAKEGRGRFVNNRQHAFYVAAFHGPRGAEFLEQIGSEQDVIDLVRDHHQPGLQDWRMVILQSADSKS